MSPTKVEELRQDHRGDRRQCPICTPVTKGSGKITLEELWAWSLRHPGRKIFRADGPDATHESPVSKLPRHG